MGGHAGPPLPLLRPSSALRASSGLRSGNGGPACPPTFAHSAQFSHNLILLSQKKAIYSAKTNLLSQRKPLYAYYMTFLCLFCSIHLTFLHLNIHAYKESFGRRIDIVSSLLPKKHITPPPTKGHFFNIVFTCN